MTSSVSGSGSSTEPVSPGGHVLGKLPHITALFWVMKIVAVTLGETAGDLVGITLQTGYVVTELLFLGYFVTVLVLQVRGRRFRPAIYWAVVVGTSLVGTEMSDLIDRGPGYGSEANGIGYGWGALALTAALAIIFLVWWRSGQTYDVENIVGRRGEILYWTAILVSNTLGTASGDWLSDDLGLGFGTAFLIIAAMMVLITAAHYLTRVNAMLLFWLAFVLTRPLGAAGGDYLTKPADEGGLGWGTTWGSAALCGLLIMLIAYQTLRLRNQPRGLQPHPVNERTNLSEVANDGVAAHGRS